ncbi:antitoxin VapB32 [bacterium BMS3Abin04]|nr:antitoxin VapB32 [bacterium BMS3Abin04]
MKTTLNIDEEILRKAAFLTGVKEKTSLVRMGLTALIARESAKRLALLGGSEKSVSKIRRRKSN